MTRHLRNVVHLSAPTTPDPRARIASSRPSKALGSRLHLHRVVGG